jgi:hypothetical protein
MRFYSVNSSLLTTRTFDRTFQITAILKLLKLPVCPLIQQLKRGEEAPLHIDDLAGNIVRGS